MSTLQQKEYLKEVRPRVWNITKRNKLVKTLQFSLISLILIICLSLNCANCAESKPDTKKSSEIEAGTQITHEIDSLYDELLQTEENIGKSIRKLQLLQKIQKTKVSLHSVQSLNKENALNSEINVEEGTVDTKEDYNYENLFKEKLSHEELSVSNSFVEKNIFELQNTSFVKYAFLDTPAYVDSFRDYTEKVLIALLSNGNLAIFSLNSGEVTNSYNLTSLLSQDPSVPIPQSWEAEVQNFLASSYESYMSVIFSDSSGNTYIIDLSIQPVKSNDSEEKEVKRSIRELGISNFKYFNAWQEIKQSNPTLYEEEILKAEEQISITKLTYFPNRDQGILVFVDGQGYFNLFRRISSQNSETDSSHQVLFFKRVHSGFGNVEIVKQQMYLTLFTEQNKIGFIRAFDGEKGNADCTLNTTQIVDLDFDKDKPGIFYALTQQGDIIMIQAKTKSGRDVICEEFGRILSTEQNSKLLALSNTIVTYSTNSDLMQVFNITNYDAKSSNIEGVTMKKMKIRDEIVNSRNQLMISISENQNKLMLIDIIYSKYLEEPWYITYLGNKGLVFTVIIMIIIAYQIIRGRASPEDEESEQFKGIKKLLEKNSSNMNQHNAKLQEISKNLAFFGGQSPDKSPGGMKSNLRDPKSPMNSVMKNVRFADQVS